MRRKTPETLAGASLAAIAVLVSSLLVPPSATAAAPVEAVTAYLTGLDFPVAFAFCPDGRLFFNEKFTGNVRVADASGASPRLLATPFAVVSNLNTTAEMGLLGMAVDPAWASTPWLYVYHTYDDGTLRENRITRFWAATNVSSASEVIFRGIPAWDYHNGGILQFGPDGKLWVTTGDAFYGDRAGNISWLGGKVLRIDKNGTLPADNPFPGSPVYSLGHRNVFGLAFNPRTGAPVITENGELTNDEVNVLRPGGNYGWPWDEGFANNSSTINPIWAITPTIAPTGIVTDISRHSSDGLVDVIFGDWNTGSLRRLVLEPPGYDRVVQEDLVFTRAVTHIMDLDFGPGGLLYLSTPEGIYTSNLTVVGNQLPVPIIQTNRTAQFEGRPLSFDGGHSFDPEGGGIYSHAWEFGDGTTATGSWIIHSYGAAGNYTVRLTVTDELGAANTTAVAIRIVSLGANEPPVPLIYASRPIQFENRSISFGGGSSYDPEDGGIWSFQWDFGDGFNASGSWVNHSFALAGNHTVRLTVTDELGIANSSTKTVRILSLAENTPPVAVADVASPRGWAGRPVNFSAARSQDREGGLVAYLWDFADGSNSTVSFVGHVFATPGTFNVTLTVWDEVGASANSSLTVQVLDPASNRPPVAILSGPSGVSKAGAPVFFSGAGSSDAEGGIYSHQWQFGDGDSATGAVVNHTYAMPGTYRVVLTVQDELGAANSSTYLLTVYDRSIPPIASFVMSNWTTELGSPIYFDGSASSDPDGWIAGARWDFGDGHSADGLQVWHYFSAPGNYNVSLTVTDNSGVEQTNLTVVRVTEPPRTAASPIGAAMAVAVAAAVVLWAAKRRP